MSKKWSSNSTESASLIIMEVIWSTVNTVPEFSKCSEGNINKTTAFAKKNRQGEDTDWH